MIRVKLKKKILLIPGFSANHENINKKFNQLFLNFFFKEEKVGF